MTQQLEAAPSAAAAQQLTNEATKPTRRPELPFELQVRSHQGKHLGTIQTPREPADLTWDGVGADTLSLMAGPYVYPLESKATGDLSCPEKASR